MLNLLVKSERVAVVVAPVRVRDVAKEKYVYVIIISIEIKFIEEEIRTLVITFGGENDITRKK